MHQLIHRSSSVTADIVGQYNNSQPYTGLSVCLSGDASNAVKCGTISAVYTSWTSNTCNCVQYGGDTSYSTVVGDSGAPVYHWQYLPNGVDQVAYAVGVGNSSAGNFARIQNVLDGLVFTTLVT